MPPLSIDGRNSSVRPMTLTEQLSENYPNYKTILKNIFNAQTEQEFNNSMSEVNQYFDQPNQQEKKSKFLEALKLKIIEFSDGFPFDEKKITLRLAKISKSIETFKILNNGSIDDIKETISLKIGRNFPLISPHLQDQSLSGPAGSQSNENAAGSQSNENAIVFYSDASILSDGTNTQARSMYANSIKQNFDRLRPYLNFDSLYSETFKSGWIPNRSIKPTLNQFRYLLQESGKDKEKQDFCKLIAKSLVKAKDFDEDLFEECKAYFFSSSLKDTFVKAIKDELLAKFDRSTMEVKVDIDSCIKIFNSIKDVAQNDDFKENFLKKLGEAKELIHKESPGTADRLLGSLFINIELIKSKDLIKELDEQSRKIFTKSLSNSFLSNVLLISRHEIEVLEELNPDFHTENPDFKKVFFKKFGQQYHLNLRGDDILEIPKEDNRLKGYFCEGLSQALVKFGTNPDNLKNSLQLFEVIKGISEFDEYKSKFDESSKTNIDNNLNVFTEKFAKSFDKFLTKVDDISEANDLIDKICNSNSLELITEIKRLLDIKRSANDDSKEIANGIEVDKIDNAFTRLGGTLPILAIRTNTQSQSLTAEDNQGFNQEFWDLHQRNKDGNGLEDVGGRSDFLDLLKKMITGVGCGCICPQKNQQQKQPSTHTRTSGELVIAPAMENNMSQTQP